MRDGFTLIELLVVVTIIVVLLALLTPALDRAVYQAELAVCAGKLRTVAMGAINYAYAQKKYYPDRPSRTSNGSNRPCDLYWGVNAKKDDRTVLKTFLGLNASLNDPLIRPIDIEGSQSDSRLAATYALYFGWGYDKVDLGDKVMTRIGDRWTYTVAGSGPSIIDHFKVLASDWDGLLEAPQRNQSSHPDRDGVLVNFTIQDQLYNGTVPPHQQTLSVWNNTQNNSRRGLIDTNYAFDDGAVQRFSDVQWDEGEPGQAGGQGLVRVPQADAQNSPGSWLRVPSR